MSQTNTQSPSEDQEATASESTNDAPCMVTIDIGDDGLEACAHFLTSLNIEFPLTCILFTPKGMKPEQVRRQLSGVETISVEVFKETTDAAANTCYIIPPSVYIALDHDELLLIDGPEHGHLPIDLFLDSTAETSNTHPIALFFTPQVSHCIEGLKSVREQGGLILHHARSSPVAAADEWTPYLTALIDGSLPIQLIVELVQTFIRASYASPSTSLSLKQEDIQALEEIYYHLKSAAGIRLSDFDLIFVLQQLHQRLHVFNLQHIKAYADIVADNPREALLFARRLSLKHTSFFHESAAMQHIAQEVLPRLLTNKGPSDVVRAWAPACSTGEELFSLAILLRECATSQKKSPEIQLIGTDTDAAILHLARQASFAPDSLSIVPKAMRERYFDLQNGQYKLKDALLERIHFSNLAPSEILPYADLDLIYCRDFLPRLKNDIQQKVLKSMQRSLNASGVLVVGEGEWKGTDVPAFVPADKSGFVFKPRTKERQEERGGQKIALFRQQETDAVVPHFDSSTAPAIGELHRDLLLQLFAPVSVIARPDFSILDQFGPVGEFIAWPNNGNTVNLLHAFPENVRKDLAQAVTQALQQKKTLKSMPLLPDHSGVLRPFRLQIRPLQYPGEKKGLVQIVFLTPESAAPRMASQGEIKSAQKPSKAGSQADPGARPEASTPRRTAEESDELLLDLKQQNGELRSTNKELLALNRDLVLRVEDLRKKMQKNPPVQNPPQPAPDTDPQQSATTTTPSPSPTVLQQQLTQFASQRHELRSALTTIMGFADLLSERLSDANDKELAQYIGKAGHRISESLDSLLNMEAGQPETPQPASPPLDEIEPSERLLVVEDSDATRRLLTLVLSDRFDCEIAADAAEAIEKAERELFKAVLLDINLGVGKSGIDVLEHLKQNQRYQHVPFMAVTAMATPQDESMLLRHGFDAFVAKPFQKAKLLNTLDAMLAQKYSA